MTRSTPTTNNPWVNEDFSAWMRVAVAMRWSTVEKLHGAMHGEGGLVNVDGKTVRLSEKSHAAKVGKVVRTWSKFEPLSDERLWTCEGQWRGPQ